MKAEFIAELGGFDERYEVAADWELIVKALLAETPVVWMHPLGRFELGGASSLRILSAHLELRTIRRLYLWKNWRDRILDDMWCSVYLRYFGFFNYLTPIIVFLSALSKFKARTYVRTWKILNAFMCLGYSPFSFHIFSKSSSGKFEASRMGLIAFLHSRLGILPYIQKK
jgi:hypothetical protein